MISPDKQRSIDFIEIFLKKQKKHDFPSNFGRKNELGVDKNKLETGSKEIHTVRATIAWVRNGLVDGTSSYGGAGWCYLFVPDWSGTKKQHIS